MKPQNPTLVPSYPCTLVASDPRPARLDCSLSCLCVFHLSHSPIQDSICLFIFSKKAKIFTHLYSRGEPVVTDSSVHIMKQKEFTHTANCTHRHSKKKVYDRNVAIIFFKFATYARTPFFLSLHFVLKFLILVISQILYFFFEWLPVQLTRNARGLCKKIEQMPKQLLQGVSGKGWCGASGVWCEPGLTEIEILQQIDPFIFLFKRMGPTSGWESFPTVQCS